MVFLHIGEHDQVTLVNDHLLGLVWLVDHSCPDVVLELRVGVCLCQLQDLTEREFLVVLGVEVEDAEGGGVTPIINSLLLLVDLLHQEVVLVADDLIHPTSLYGLHQLQVVFLLGGTLLHIGDILSLT